jgi:hypothetical protein
MKTFNRRAHAWKQSRKQRRGTRRKRGGHVLSFLFSKKKPPALAVKPSLPPAKPDPEFSPVHPTKTREHVIQRNQFIQMKPTPGEPTTPLQRVLATPVDVPSAPPEEPTSPSVDAEPVPVNVEPTADPPVPVNVEPPALTRTETTPNLTRSNASDPAQKAAFFESKKDSVLYYKTIPELTVAQKIKLATPYVPTLLGIQFNLFWKKKAEFYKAVAKLLNENKPLLLQGEGDVLRQIMNAPNQEPAVGFIAKLGLGSLVKFVYNDAFATLMKDRSESRVSTLLEGSTNKLKTALDELDAAFKLLLRNVIDVKPHNGTSLRDYAFDTNPHAFTYFLQLFPQHGGNRRRKIRRAGKSSTKTRKAK